jgi:hypothetical protein
MVHPRVVSWWGFETENHNDIEYTKIYLVLVREIFQADHAIFRVVFYFFM